MDRLTKEYIELLSSSAPVEDRFWELEKRIKQDKRSPSVLIHMSCSDMEWNLVKLILDDAITLKDLAVFSDETRERVEYLVQSAKRLYEEDDEEYDDEDDIPE